MALLRSKIILGGAFNWGITLGEIRIKPPAKMVRVIVPNIADLGIDMVSMAELPG